MRKLQTITILLLVIGLSFIPTTGSLSIKDQMQSSSFIDEDKTPPVTNILFDPSEPDGDNKWYVSNVEITMYATDDISGVNTINYRVDGGEWESSTDEMIFFKIWEDGCHFIEYYSVDNAGNQETVNHKFLKIDQSVPEIDEGIGLKLDKDKFELIVISYDEMSNIDRVEFFVNNNRVYTDKDFPYKWIWGDPDIEDCPWFRVYDKAGNYVHDIFLRWFGESASGSQSQSISQKFPYISSNQNVGSNIPSTETMMEKSSPLYFNSKILYVGGDGSENYSEIQDAIDDAAHGDTVFVYSGTYYENVAIDVSITIMGEDRDTTVIDGSGNKDNILHIYAPYVVITGFTLQNSQRSGIFIDDDPLTEGYTFNNIIYRNIIKNTNCGIGIAASENNEIYENNITNNRGFLNMGMGICIAGYYGDSINNSIYQNNIMKNDYGIYLFSHMDGEAKQNRVYQNNLFYNKRNAVDQNTNNYWDNEEEGNYWDDYTGEDGDDDGIGDEPYWISKSKDVKDNCPLMKPVNNVTNHNVNSHKLQSKQQNRPASQQFSYMLSSQNFLNSIQSNSDTVETTYYKPNNFPYAPGNPYPHDGDINVPVDVSLGWTGGDPNPEDTVIYDFYFGEDPNPLYIMLIGPFNATFTNFTYQPDILVNNKTYYWKIIATDNHDASRVGPLWTFSTGVNHPPEAPDVEGPETKPVSMPLPKPGEHEDFKFQTTDPDGHDMYYYIDWGDGYVSDWFGPYNSGEKFTKSHTYYDKGTYAVRAKAKDIYGLESEWGTIKIPIGDLQIGQESELQIKELDKQLSPYGLKTGNSIGDFEQTLYKLISKSKRMRPSLSAKLKQDVAELSNIFHQIGITDDMTIAEALSILEINKEKLQEEGINLFCSMDMYAWFGDAGPLYRLYKVLYGIWLVELDDPKNRLKIESGVIGLQYCEKKETKGKEGMFIGLIGFNPPVISSDLPAVMPGKFRIQGYFTLYSKSNIPFISCNDYTYRSKKVSNQIKPNNCPFHLFFLRRLLI